MLNEGKYSEFREKNLTRYALGFNFVGKYVSDHRGDGLMLNFYAPDCQHSLYSFSPLNAAVFTQAMLDICGIEREVEIVYSYIGGENSVLSGCFSITREDLEHLPLEHLQPAAAQRNGEHFYAFNLAENEYFLPQYFVAKEDEGKLNKGSIPNLTNDDIQVVIDNLHLYHAKKITHFDFNIISNQYLLT